LGEQTFENYFFDPRRLFPDFFAADFFALGRFALDFFAADFFPVARFTDFLLPAGLLDFFVPAGFVVAAFVGFLVDRFCDFFASGCALASGGVPGIKLVGVVCATAKSA